MQAATHICILSGQVLPNLIPALQERPGSVWVLASDDMVGQGRDSRLAGLLEKAGIACSFEKGLPSHGYAAIRRFALEWSSRSGVDIEASVLNITGGNKLMTLALVDALGPRVSRVIYTDTANGQLEVIPRDGHPAMAPIALQSVVDVDTALAAQGMTVTESLDLDEGWRDRAAERRDLTKHLGRNAGTLAQFIGALNRVANAALDDRGEQLAEPRQWFSRPPLGEWRQATKRIANAGQVVWDGECGLTFDTVEKARYLAGGWLEEFAWHQVRALRPFDVRAGVRGAWDNTTKGSNELDLVVTHGNRLLLVECKTLRLGRNDNDDDRLLYKLDSVGDDVKGIFGDVVLLSARTPSDAVRDRARQHGIHVIGPDRLHAFQKCVRDWMETGRFAA